MSNKRAIITVVGLLLAINLVMGIRWFIAARSTKAANPCVNQLRMIDGAKEQWVLENDKTTNDTPTWDDIVPYLKSKPVCPDGGIYTLGRVGEPPTCSIGGQGHTLPQ